MFLRNDDNQALYKWMETAIHRGLHYHTLFWIVFFFFLIIIDNSDVSLPSKMAHKIVRLTFYILIVYTNIIYLFSNFLKSSKLLTYLISLSILLAFTTVSEIMVHYYLFRPDELSLQNAMTPKNISIFFLNGFFIAFSSTIYKIINDWVEHQRECTELQRQNLKSELKFLKTQINPHFFFNTLNSLYALTLKKSDKAPEIVLKLSEMMRYMLYESNERTISLNKEIEFVKNYIELEKLRFGQQAQVLFEVNGNPNGHKIAPLLFMAFLENSFKHSLNKNLSGGYIKINLDITDDRLYWQIENNKAPHQFVQHNSGGIGLVNVQRRLNLMYPKQHSLDISENEDHYFVKLSIYNTHA